MNKQHIIATFKKSVKQEIKWLIPRMFIATIVTLAVEAVFGEEEN